MQEGRTLARALGWFGIGLGLAELFVPGEVARLAGVRDTAQNRAVLRVCGLRELAAGIGIMSRKRPAGWMWSRVAGDVLDLGLLAAASPGADPARLCVAAGAVAGITALDLRGAGQLTGRARLSAATVAGGRVEITKTVRVQRPVAEVWAFWRDLGNLPRIVPNLELVGHLGGDTSRWRVKGPAGRTVEWDAEVTDEREGEVLAWRSLPGADVENHGEVRFHPAPAGRGTDVTVQLRYAPPGGTMGRLVATLFGKEPEQQVREALRAFRQVMEAGETPWSDAQAAKVHPARPPKRPVAERHFPQVEDRA